MLKSRSTTRSVVKFGPPKPTGWGAKVIDRLSTDLRSAFPQMKWLSSSNLKYMRFFAQEWPDRQIGKQSADQLPWFHISTIITKISDPDIRDWYARKSLAQSWPRETLSIQIKNQLHLRQGPAVTNFERRVVPPQAGLAAQILKAPYHFGSFLSSCWMPSVIAKNALSSINECRTCFGCGGSGSRTFECRPCGTGRFERPAEPCFTCDGTGLKFGQPCRR